MRNEALYRQWQILHLIYQNGSRGISLQNLADEFGVSKRTIRRDITNLSAVGFPIYDEVDNSRGRQLFYYIISNYRIPEIQFSLPEITELYLAYLTFESYYKNDSNPLAAALKKINSTIPEEMRNFLKRMNKDIIPDDSLTLKSSENLIEKVRLIQQAINGGKRINFQYFNPFKKEYSQREVSPYGFKSYQKNFYMAGFCHSRNKIRTFAVNRISELKIISKKILKQELDLKSFFDDGFGIFSGNLRWVELHCSAEIAYFIKERNWHPQTKFQDLPDGSVIMKLPVNGFLEIKRFILSYGSNIRVLKPVALKKIIAEEIAEMKKLY
ncbi:MAG: hypothetical protein DRZ79_02175 [Candidatus Cloacimonadota bacterium]|nr:MAG: hypothetical protein DRZ79_02175 [Candidatus Cloacimonadota bacterium]